MISKSEKLELSKLILAAKEGELDKKQFEKLDSLIANDSYATEHYVEFLMIYVGLTQPYKAFTSLIAPKDDDTPQPDIDFGEELAEYEKNGIPVEIERRKKPVEKVLTEEERQAKIRAFLREERAIEERERRLAELERSRIRRQELQRRKRSQQMRTVLSKIRKVLKIGAAAAVVIVVAFYLYALLTPVPPAFVATLTDCADVKWADSRQPAEPGSQLEPGTMQLVEGYARITFNEGAGIVLEAPAEINLKNSNRAFLQLGKLSAEVPVQARGFKIDTPSASITDLGTEFGVYVAEDGTSDVHVFKGRVSLLAGRFDNMVGRLFDTVEQVVEAGQARRVKTGIFKIQKIPFNQTAFAPNIPLPYKPTPYELAMRRSNPICYWRFSGNDSRKCINSVDADRYTAEYVGSIKFESSGPDLGDGQSNDALKLSGGYVLAPDVKIDGLELRGSSIALWLRPDIISSNKQSIIWQDTSGKPGSVGFERLLFMDEKGHLGFLIFTDMYDENDSNIVEVLSTKKLQAGRWSHVAVTVASDNVQLSINGQISKTRINLTSQILDPDLIWHTFVGTPRNNRGEGEYFVLGRSTYSIFKGDVDEVALFNRALSAEEISRLYMSAGK